MYHLTMFKIEEAQTKVFETYIELFGAKTGGVRRQNS